MTNFEDREALAADHEETLKRLAEVRELLTTMRNRADQITPQHLGGAVKTLAEVDKIAIELGFRVIELEKHASSASVRFSELMDRLQQLELRVGKLDGERPVRPPSALV